MDKKIKIILADNHEIIREGIKSALNGYLSYEIIATVSSGRELLKTLNRFRKVDILLLSFDMPPRNGFETLFKVRVNFPEISVIILGIPENFETQLQCITMGAKAFLKKEYSVMELTDTITAVCKYGFFINERISSKLSSQKVSLKISFKSITPREQEILSELEKGKTEAQIASTFGISKTTVHTHKNNLLKKTNTHNTTQLLKEAVRRGLL